MVYSFGRKTNGSPESLLHQCGDFFNEKLEEEVHIPGHRTPAVLTQTYGE